MPASPFQSTRPSRDGTRAEDERDLELIHISIHPPLAGRDIRLSMDRVDNAISIHPPLAGRDCFHEHLCLVF